MTAASDQHPSGPLAQSVAIGFRVVAVAVVVLAVAWLGTGIRQVEPGMRAVVLRFGAINREVAGGLVIAWPRPIEEVVLVPGPDRQLSLEVTEFDNQYVQQGDDNDATLPTGAGYVLTGGADLVQMRASLIYNVDRPSDYVLMQERLRPALTRLFMSATTAACAGRRLEEIVAARSQAASEDAADLAQRRERLKVALTDAVNAQLHELAYGITVSRIDLNSFVPYAVQANFENASTAEAQSAQNIAAARTEAVAVAQQAASDQGRIVSSAQAKARELLTQARVDTDRIAAVAQQEDPRQRWLLLTRLYRERIEVMLKRTQNVTVVDGTRPVRLILPSE